MISKDQIVSEMQAFHFSAMDARVYVYLLENPGVSAYQIGNGLGVPRSTVYACLEKLMDRNAVYLQEGRNKTYQVQGPRELFQTLEREYRERAQRLGEALAEIRPNRQQESYYTLSGEDANVQKAREMVVGAQKEILINAGRGLGFLAEELKSAVDRGVRLVVFSFQFQKNLPQGAELYHRSDLEQVDSPWGSLQLVCDLDRALIFSGNRGESTLGTYSENEFFVHQVSVTIHLDIYLQRLEAKQGENLITPEIQLGSLMEGLFGQRRGKSCP